MVPKRFKITKWFIVANYIVIPFCFLFSAFFFYNAIPRWDYMFRSDIAISTFFTLCGIGFALGGIYSTQIVSRLGETIVVTDTSIIQEHSNNTTTQLDWNESFSVRNRTFLGRLELISRDGQRKILIEKQLENFEELRDLIYQKRLEHQENPAR